MRSLVGLGVSGGLLPCTAALVLLLSTVAMGRTGLGMILVIAFSLGLAGVLTAVGLLFVKGGRIIQKTPRVSGYWRFLPAASAMMIFVLGVIITVGAAAQVV